MEHVEVSNSTLKKVREIVDFIYEVTVGDGSPGGWGKYPTRTQIAVSIMVKRGIIERKGTKVKPIYRWSASMAPTGNLYKSIAEEIVMKERETVRRWSAKKRNASVVVAEDKNPNSTRDVTAISSFSSQELWDELKRRGYAIEDGRLVVVKKDYLD